MEIQLGSPDFSDLILKKNEENIGKI